jgi:DNA-binding GntR family transcriptional regulator
MVPETLAKERKIAAEEEPGLNLIKRVSLRDMTVEHIRQAIERSELKAGERLTELGLARRLGVGQPTIREALIELEFLGFIERKGPRNTRVTLLSRDAIQEIYLVRIRLETLAAELVAGQNNPELRACWTEAIRMEEAAKQGKPVDFYQADLSFHRALWKASRNESLRTCLEQLVPKLMTFSIIQRVHPSREKLLEIAGVHRRLLEMIATGNIAETVRVMSDSMQTAQADDEQMPGIQ